MQPPLITDSLCYRGCLGFKSFWLSMLSSFRALECGRLGTKYFNCGHNAVNRDTINSEAIVWNVSERPSVRFPDQKYPWPGDF